MNTQTKPRLRPVNGFHRALMVGLGINLLTGPTPLAQEPAGPVVDPADGEVRRMNIKTGSLIPTASEVETPQPILTVTSADLAHYGTGSLERTVAKLSSAMGGGNFGNSRGNGGDGTAAIALRGIDGGTLLLVNGRRMARSDLNAIPTGAVDRIEILKDGGSSTYGADAVAGVVNVILKKDFNGVEISSRYGNTTDKDAGELRWDVILGIANPKTSLLFGASYLHQNGLLSGDRERSRPDISDPNNTSGTSNPGRILSTHADPDSALGSSGLVYRGAPGTSSQDLSLYTPYDGSTDRFPYSLYTPAVRPAERWSFFGNGEHAIFGENLKLRVDGFYTKSKSFNQLAPVPIVFNETETPTSPDGIVIPAGNPHNPFGIDIDDAVYRAVELGPRIDSSEYDIVRFVGGFKGQVADSTWHWETAALYGYQDGVNLQGNDISRTALESAVNGTDPRTSFNPFGNAANNRAVVNAIRLDHYTEDEDSLLLLDAMMNGEVYELPGGPIQVGFGGEHREEESIHKPDDTLTSRDVVGFNSDDPFRGSRSINGVFYEVKVPILGQEWALPGAKKLELTHSGRYENYSDFGSTYNPRIAVLYQPIDSLSVRASVSESFSAPGFDELKQNSESYPELINPVRQAGVDAGTFTEEDYPPFEQIRTFYKGNASIKPATAKNYTAGFAWTPPAVKELKIEMDWFRLEQENISSFVDQYIIDENYRTGGPTDPNALYANRIEWDAKTLQYNTLDATALNLSHRVVEGFDLDITYALKTETAGTFTSRTLGSYYYRFEQENIPGEGLRDRLGDFTQPEASFGLGSLPRLKGVTSIFWEYFNFEFGPTLNYVGSYRDSLKSDPLDTANRRISSWMTLDLQASYRFDRGILRNSHFTVGCLNVTDEAPPLVEGAYADRYDRDTHNILGRFWYVEFSKKF